MILVLIKFQDVPEVFSKIITLDDTGDVGRQYYIPQYDQSRIILFKVMSLVIDYCNNTTKSTMYNFQATAIWTRKLVYRPAMHTYSCRASTLSPAPDSVQSLNVTSYCFNHSDEIVLEFSWSPPLTFNGVPASYDVYIGPEPMEYTGEVEPNKDHSGDLESLSVSLQVGSFSMWSLVI